MNNPSESRPARPNDGTPSPGGRKVALQGTPSWALALARALRDWNLLYYRSVRVYRCDRLDDTSATPRTDVEVVEATEGDVPRLAPLQGSSAAEWFARLANGHICLVARSESGDLGYLWITCGLHYMQEVDHVVDVSHHSKAAYLHDAYVLPDARNQGIFRALMDSAKEWARTRGLSTLYTAVARDNEISERAIESTGFTRVVGQVTLVRVRNHTWKRVRRLSGVDVLA
jgi:GNAT superfamily N-acetyltransferase